MKKKADEFMTSRGFAEEMGVNYRTALNWLRGGLVPGAVEEETPIGKYWKIPRTALEMERPMKPGPKPRMPNNEHAASSVTEEKPARPTKKAGKAGSKKSSKKGTK